MKKFKKIFFIVGVVLSCFSCKNNKEQASSNEAVSNDELQKPNIIYILADDLGYGDLSIYGQEKFETPNIDQLAKNGMLFTQHYSGSTVCAPSRSTLLTGMHTGHTVVRGNKEISPEGQYPIPDSTYTLAKALKKGGYVNGVFGKWGLGYPGSEGDPIAQGFDTFFGYNCQRLGHNYYPRHLWSNSDSIVLPENEGKLRGTYAPHLIHEKTLRFIEEQKDTSFFAYVASIIPHAELAAPEDIVKKYRGKYPPEKPFKGTDDGETYRLGPYMSQEEPHATYAAMVEILDTQVGEIVAKLNELGIADNTLIIFTSDNGPHREGGANPSYFNSNGVFRGFKRDLYEGGIRVPMIASWPKKIKSGSTSNHISAFWDVFPTFTEIAGIDTPDNIDGVSFLPSLFGELEDQKKHEYLYWEFHEKGGRQAIRKGDWKAVKNNVLKEPNADLELYNLAADPSEKNNVAAQYKDVVKEMEKILKTARTPSDVFTFSQEAYLKSN